MAAAARPYWTGFLKLSLVTIAVRLYSATTEKEHIQAALKELIDEKLAGQLPERPLERKPAQVIDLMDALKRSLAEEGAEKTGGKARPARRNPGKRSQVCFCRSAAASQTSPRRSPPRRRGGARKLPEIGASGVGAFRGAGSARETGTHEYGLRRKGS
jgi:hypothetical protein